MNNSIFYFFYNLAHQSNLFDNIVIFFAVYFPYFVALMAGIFFVFYRKNWREFFVIFFTGGLTVVFDLILKYSIHVTRPFLSLPNIYPLFPEAGYAFPSGHAAVFSAIAFAIYFKHKKAGFVFMLFAFLIGLARIIAGVHFPIDIFGGFILGFVVAFLIKKISNLKKLI